MFTLGGHGAMHLGHTFRACAPRSLFGALRNLLEPQGTLLERVPKRIMDAEGVTKALDKYSA